MIRKRLVVSISVFVAIVVIAVVAILLNERSKHNSQAGGPPITTGASTVAEPADPNQATGKQFQNIKDFGGVCDGVHNDQGALKQAISAIKKSGGGVVEIPASTCRIVQSASSPTISLDGSITIRGASDKSSLSLDSDQPGQFRSLFRISGSSVGIKDLLLSRAAGVTGVMLAVWPIDGLHLDNVMIDGNRQDSEDAYLHAITLNGSQGQTIQNIWFNHVTVKDSDYGLLQDSSVKVSARNISVLSSTFSGNYADDLEFNAPKGDMSSVVVADSKFTANRATKVGAGFGVGLANVHGVTIARNSFDGYRYEPVHVEDRSSNILINQNTFANTFTSDVSYASSIFVISGSNKVRIVGNTFDTSANANNFQCVYVGRGGSQSSPHDVQVTSNTFKLRKNAKPVGVFGAENVTTTKSSVIPLS